MKQQLNLGEVIRVLDLPANEIPELSPGPSKILQRKLDAFKSLCERHYRKQMLKYHPDVNPDIQAKETAIELNKVIKAVRSLKIIDIPIPPREFHFEVRSYYFRYGNYYTDARGSQFTTSTCMS